MLNAKSAGAMPRIKWRRNKKSVGLPLRVTPSSPSLSLERISLLSLSIGAPRKFNKCAPLRMAILMACFGTDGRLFCQPVILVIAFVTHVDSVHLQQKGNDSTVAEFEFVFMPGVGLNISSRKIPSDVFMWRSFQCSNRLSMRRFSNCHCDFAQWHLPHHSCANPTSQI